jgi:hypothetical protein
MSFRVHKLHMLIILVTPIGCSEHVEEKFDLPAIPKPPRLVIKASSGSSVTSSGSSVMSVTPSGSSAASSSSSAASSSSSANSSGHLVVGAPCKRGDGWEPPAVANAAEIDASAGPVIHDRNHLMAIGWKDFNELARGIGYCMPPGGIYPDGYFTMNCAADADCPGGAFCDQGQCHSHCAVDSDCGTGMSCSGFPQPSCQGAPPRHRG